MTTEAAAREYLMQHLIEWGGKEYASFNPQARPLEELPVICAFSSVVGGGDGICYAIAEDGHVLGSHWCSHEGYAPHDLGVLKGAQPDRHEEYQKHYPDGYRMDFIPAKDAKEHAGLTAVFALNQKLPKEEDSSHAPR